MTEKELVDGIPPGSPGSRSKGNVRNQASAGLVAARFRRLLTIDKAMRRWTTRSAISELAEWGSKLDGADTVYGHLEGVSELRWRERRWCFRGRRVRRAPQAASRHNKAVWLNRPARGRKKCATIQ